jgi:hypothetical protein
VLFRSGVYTAGNGSTACIWTVPAGYTAYITNYSAGYGNAITAYGTAFLAIRPFGSVFDTASQVRVSNGSQGWITFNYPIPVEEKSDIEIRANSTTASANVVAEFQIIYIKNDGAL